MSSSSIREQIVLAAVALLNASGKPSGLVVDRERTHPSESSQLPAIHVYCEDEEPSPLKDQSFRSPIVQHHLVLMCELRAQASASVPPDAAIDPLYVWAAQQVLQNEEFGGLAMGVTEGPMKWKSREADAIYAAADLRFVVHYRTTRVDPTSVT